MPAYLPASCVSFTPHACRQHLQVPNSPTAVFTALVHKRGLSHRFDIDSCGTGGGTGGGSPDWYVDGGYSYHQGDADDSRMTTTAMKRGGGSSLPAGDVRV